MTHSPLLAGRLFFACCSAALCLPEFMEMIADTGAGIYACKASTDLFELTKDDLIEQVMDIITVGEFYSMAAGGEIIFT